ncbi:MAG: hypothetical protein K8T20_12025 [Planctomycetes bacterium]|nr:hypothetical protein [Planctomycetota bacterium]
MRTLMDQCGFTWRERCVLEALILLARPDGRVYHGNVKLAALASEVGPAIAVAMGYRRRRLTARLDLPYFCRLLAYLYRLGLVDRFWPRLSAKGRWHRVLRIVPEALLVYAAWGQSRGRRWRSRDGRLPDAPEPRNRKFKEGRGKDPSNGREHKYTDGNWRYMHGPEWGCLSGT